MLISFLFLNKNIYCGYSLEAPRRGASNEYPQYMYSWRNKKNIMYIPPLICSYAQHAKLYLWRSEPSEDSNRLVHPHNLFKVYVVFPLDSLSTKVSSKVPSLSQKTWQFRSAFIALKSHLIHLGIVPCGGRTCKRLLVSHSSAVYISWPFVIIKGSISLKNRHFIIQKRFNKLIHGIYTIIKCGTWQPVKFQLSLSFLKWNDFFNRISELMLPTLIQIYDKKSFHFWFSSKTRD